MRLSAPIYKLKRQAKLLAREQGVALHDALDQVATANGFRSWSLLASISKLQPAERIMKQLCPGDMLLLGARPGHGKTLLGLELAIAASKLERKSFFFTLEFNDGDVLGQLETLGIDTKKGANSLIVDTSDDICADYIIDQSSRMTGDIHVVIDYLQLLDQKRANPELSIQIETLKSYAQSSGAIITAISQINRAFDLKHEGLPGISDVRLPNPFDLTLFNKTCFLHNGEIKFELAA